MKKESAVHCSQHGHERYRNAYYLLPRSRWHSCGHVDDDVSNCCRLRGDAGMPVLPVGAGAHGPQAVHWVAALLSNLPFHPPAGTCKPTAASAIAVDGAARGACTVTEVPDELHGVPFLSLPTGRCPLHQPPSKVVRSIKLQPASHDSYMPRGPRGVAPARPPAHRSTCAGRHSVDAAPLAE